MGYDDVDCIQMIQYPLAGCFKNGSEICLRVNWGITSLSELLLVSERTLPLKALIDEQQNW